MFTPIRERAWRPHISHCLRNVRLILCRAPTLQQYIIGMASDVQQARQAISLFARSMLRPGLRSLSLVDTLTAIEQAAVTHSGSFAEAAAAAGANALTIVNSVLGKHVAIGKSKVQAPGSSTHLWVWLTANASLLYAKLVWDITQICTDFGISDPSAYCWPVLVTRKSINNCLAVCDNHRQAAHTHPMQGAHERIQGFDPNDHAIVTRYSRAATAEELAELPDVPRTKTGASDGRGITKTSGRGRGRGRSQQACQSFRGRA